MFWKAKTGAVWEVQEQIKAEQSAFLSGGIMTYLEQMKADIIDYIKSEDIDLEQDRDDIANDLSEELWTVDSVTGNGSGSYTFNTAKAREYVLENGEEYVKELIEEFCLDSETVAKHLFDWKY